MIDETITEQIRAFLTETDRKGKGYITQSSVGRCVREIWYEVHEYPKEDLDGRAIAVFRFGDLIEEMVIRLLKDMGLRTSHTGEDQLTLHIDSPFGTLKGHPDGLIEDRIMLEIKSTSEVGFKRSPGYGKLEEFPKDDAYWWQIQSYMNSKELKERGIQQCLVILVSKNTSHMTAFLVDRDPEFEAMLHDKLAQATFSIPPPRPYQPKHFPRKKKFQLEYPCSYCGFKESCFEKEGLQVDASSGKPIFWYNE